MKKALICLIVTLSLLVGLLACTGIKGPDNGGTGTPALAEKKRCLCVFCPDVCKAVEYERSRSRFVWRKHVRCVRRKDDFRGVEIGNGSGICHRTEHG